MIAERTVRAEPVGASPPDGRRRSRRSTRPALLALLGLAAGTALWRRRRPSAVPEPQPPAPLPGRPRLVGVLGGTLRHGAATEAPELVLHQGRQVLGRAKDAEIRLPDLTLSPRHALIEADHSGRVVVRDLGARNGLYVDGIPVAEAELHDGNRLQLGDVRLIYRVDPEHDDGGRHGGELGENIGH